MRVFYIVLLLFGLNYFAQAQKTITPSEARGKTLKLTGKVSTYRGNPKIERNNPQKIKIAEEKNIQENVNKVKLPARV